MGVTDKIRMVVEEALVGDLRVEEIMVSQAKRRIDNQGDSQVTYPRLSAKQNSYRYEGMALRDTSNHIYNTLHGRAEQSGDGATFYVSGSMIAFWHHHGFSTEGPNFIPLTRKAVRRHVTGRDPRQEGLKPGVDYRMAWKGVTVPARPIVNFPPEDVSEIADTIALAIRDEVRFKGEI